MQYKFSDKEILDGLLQGGAKVDMILKHIYVANRAVVVSFIHKNRGSTEEAKDVFQESVIAFYENVKSGKFRGESAVSSYIYSIARFIWLNRLKRKNTEQRILDTQPVEEISEGFFPKLLAKEEEERLLKLFATLGEQCKQVLIFVIFYNYSMKEVAEQLNYESDQVARNKKYLCSKKLKDLLKKRN